MKNQEVPFEEAFKRLEEILEHLNSAELSLDASLKHYEEASLLIQSCQKQLAGAEKKVEKLIKDRNQDLKVDADRQPQLETFQTENEKAGPVI